MKFHVTAAVASAAALTLLGTTAASALSTTTTGPSSSESPYVVPVVDGVSTTSIFTVGDEIDGYTMAGIADGLGAFDNGDGTFTVLMNHEIKAGLGATHAHGAAGAFVSKWTIKNDLTVVAGEDLIKTVKDYDFATNSWIDAADPQLIRLCSSNLPEAGAFYNPESKLGTESMLYMTGEENGPEGRATATVVDGPEAGTTYLLPWLGNYSFENIVTLPNTGDKTVVMALDDSGGGQVYLYVGDKRAEGNEVEKAGLVGGTLYGVKIDDVTAETDDTSIPADGVPFSLVEIPNAENLTGDELEALSVELGVSSLARPEDGSWDPTNVNGFYFTTTASFEGVTRLWHLDFADAANAPQDGGIATTPVVGTPYDDTKSNADQTGPRMFDNLTVDDNGDVLVQEDPGNQEYVAGVWKFTPATGELVRIAQHDADRFAVGAPNFLTQDEESSGIIPVPFLGEGKYLLDVQAHYEHPNTDLVEGGQLLLLEFEQTATDEPTPAPTDEPTTEPTDEATETDEPTDDATDDATEAPATTATTTAAGDKGGLATTGAERNDAVLALGGAALVAGAATLAVARIRNRNEAV